MADPVVETPASAPVASSAPSPSPAAAPPAAPATPAPVSSAAPAPVAVPAPAVETPPAPSTEPAPAPAVDAPIQPERSRLSQLLDASKPAEQPKPAATEPAKEPAKAADATAPPAPAEKIAWEYTVPETVPLDAEGRLQAKVNFDDEARSRVNAMLDAFSTNPRDKANQQALVDFHIDRLAEQNRQIADFNRNFWNDTRKQWRERWAGDAEIGGSGIKTTEAAIERVLDIAYRWKDTSAANLAFHRDVEEFFETTGAGDHPALGRIFARLARFMDESPPPPPNLKPPPDIGRAPGQRGRRLPYRDMPA